MEEEKSVVEAVSESSQDETGENGECEVRERPEGSKSQVAKALIRQAKVEVGNAEAEIEACIDNIRSDLESLEAFERSELMPVVEQSRALLKRMGVGAAEQPAELGARIDLENPEVEKIEIKELSSGRFGAFVTGLIGAAATVGGWYYAVAMKLGLEPVPQKLPDVEAVKAMLAEVPKIARFGEGFEIGAAIVGGSALVVWWVIYALMVSSRASKNLRIAEKIDEEAQFYCRKKQECKEKMEQVRAHIAELENLARRYEAVLAENNAGLRRAFIVEGTEDFSKMHDKSRRLAQRTEELVKELDALLTTPLAEAGMLTLESMHALTRAQKIMEEYLASIYGE